MSTHDAPPPSRWARSGPQATEGFGRRFAELVAAGQDVDGEARLADALLPRGARVLDVGAGMGRVSAALQARGHRVTAVEPDGGLVAQCRATYPTVDVVQADLLELDDARVGRVLGDRPHQVDLVVCVGNVVVFLAEGTERQALATMAGRLAPGGRLLVGYHLVGGPEHARAYPPEEFVQDAASAGLRVQHRFGSYELAPPSDEYAVWVLTADA
ncbi:methyltransferase domain-containing protein [Nocardioides sp. SOB44]|uniref:Methyltransferase domain-containing protein n=1 Tax=Nocardioides cremeus TaxID=3058044 RepID=A0ABT8TX03_9ACTN|nr:methyltransferase domain-containing protein [Nocardioides cremeus]MDO3397503.1 methyltransferase domain-containing protein [Nocardioides cremeus]